MTGTHILILLCVVFFAYSIVNFADNRHTEAMERIKNERQAHLEEVLLQAIEALEKAKQ